MFKRGFMQSRGPVRSIAALVMLLVSMHATALPEQTDATLEQPEGVVTETVFGEAPFPDVDNSVSAVGDETLQLGGLELNISLPPFNEVFDYAGQNSQPDEVVALLEVEELKAAAEERSWAATIPVPEPATIALMGLGVLGLVLLSRRGGRSGS